MITEYRIISEAYPEIAFSGYFLSLHPQFAILCCAQDAQTRINIEY